MGGVIGSLFQWAYQAAANRASDIPAPPPPPALAPAPRLPSADPDDGDDDLPPVPDPPPVPALTAWPQWSLASTTAGVADAGAQIPFELPSNPASPAVEAASGARSYADTIDTAVACLPCFRRHTSTAASSAELAEAALARGDVQSAKEESVRAAGEVLLFHLYDLTPEKVAATSEETMAVIESARPDLLEAAEAAPKPPMPALAAWASTNEAVRFARSEEPGESDAREISLRLRPALKWLDQTESILLSPERTAMLPPAERARAREAAEQLRQARHYLVPESGAPTPDGMEQATAHLFRAAVELTPDPTADQVAHVRALTAQAMDRLDDHLLEAMQMGAL